MEFLLSAIVLGLSVAAPMGPVNLEIMRRGLAGGFRPAFLVGLGASTVDGTYCVLFTLGFSAVTPLASQRLAAAGGIVLTVMGLLTLWGAMRSSPPNAPDAPSKAPSTLRGYMTGLTMTAVNPMTLAFWASIGAVTGQFKLEGTGERLLFAGGVMTGALLWVIAFSTFLHQTRHRVSPSFRRAATAIGGMGIVYFGIRMLLTL